MQRTRAVPAIHQRVCVSLAFVMIGAGGAAHAAAQPIMLDLGAQTVVFAPAAEVELPLTLNAPGDGPARIMMEVSYPGDAIVFESAEAGTSAQIAGAQVSASEKAGQTADADRVIAVELKSPKPLTTGTLVTFTFKLGPKAEPGSEIRIRNVSRTATGADGQPLEIQGADGLVTVIEPLPPCFFYMH